MKHVALPVLLAALAGPAIAQDGPPDRGARIDITMDGMEISVECGRTDITDCAEAARDLMANLPDRREDEADQRGNRPDGPEEDDGDRDGDT